MVEDHRHVPCLVHACKIQSKLGGDLHQITRASRAREAAEDWPAEMIASQLRVVREPSRGEDHTLACLDQRDVGRAGASGHPYDVAILVHHHALHSGASTHHHSKSFGRGAHRLDDVSADPLGTVWHR